MQLFFYNTHSQARANQVVYVIQPTRKEQIETIIF